MTGSQSENSRLAEQIKKGVILPGIKLGWLKGQGEVAVDVQPARQSGATDALVFEATAQVTFHVKFSLTDVERERAGYDALALTDYRGHLVPSLFEDILRSSYQSGALRLVPFLPADRLNDWIASPGRSENQVKEFYADFLTTSKNVWSATQQSTRVRLRETYWKRLMERSQALAAHLGIADLRPLELVVNGETYGTFDTIWEAFLQRLDALPPVDSCVTHGDENATNIMVYGDAIRDGDVGGWVLVDYVNAGAGHDWVFSIAKMTQCWRFDYVVRLAAGNEELRQALNCSTSVDANTLRLAYDEAALKRHIPGVVQELEVATQQAADATARAFGEGHHWRERLELALFSVAFGSAALRVKDDPQVLPIFLHQTLP